MNPVETPVVLTRAELDTLRQDVQTALRLAAAPAPQGYPHALHEDVKRLEAMMDGINRRLDGLASLDATIAAKVLASVRKEVDIQINAALRATGGILADQRKELNGRMDSTVLSVQQDVGKASALAKAQAEDSVNHLRSLCFNFARGE